MVVFQSRRHGHYTCPETKGRTLTLNVHQMLLPKTLKDIYIFEMASPVVTAAAFLQGFLKVTKLLEKCIVCLLSLYYYYY